MVAIDLIVQHVHSQLEEVSEKGHYDSVLRTNLIHSSRTGEVIRLFFVVTLVVCPRQDMSNKKRKNYF